MNRAEISNSNKNFQILNDLERRTREYLWFPFLNGIMVFLSGCLTIIAIFLYFSIWELFAWLFFSIFFGLGIFAYIKRHYFVVMGVFAFYLMIDVVVFFFPILVYEMILFPIGLAIIFSSLVYGSYKLLLIFREIREVQYECQGIGRTWEIPITLDGNGYPANFGRNAVFANPIGGTQGGMQAMPQMMTNKEQL